MLKRLTRKLITFSSLVVILAAVSFTPASSTNRQILICFEMPITADCDAGYMCCDTVSGTCQCGG
jgi:hypothetical protein